MSQLLSIKRRGWFQTSLFSIGIQVFFLCFITCALCSAGENRNPPVEEDHAAVVSLNFIHKIISRGDGQTCPMHPTCSRYGFDAINKYGLIRGWIMTCDRLIRCGRDECRLAPQIIVNGKTRYHDPLSENKLAD